MDQLPSEDSGEDRWRIFAVKMFEPNERDEIVERSRPSTLWDVPCGTAASEQFPLTKSWPDFGRSLNLESWSPSYSAYQYSAELQ